MFKLKKLKAKVVEWIKRKVPQDKVMLISFENQIIEMLLNNLTGSFTLEERHGLLELEYKKDVILRKE